MITRDEIEEFILTHRGKFLIGSSVLLVAMVLLILGLVLSGNVSRKEARRLAEERKAAAIPLEELWLPPDPLTVPEVQRFNERKQRWSAEEADVWYSDPDPEMMNQLEAAAAQRVKSLLEKVP